MCVVAKCIHGVGGESSLLARQYAGTHVSGDRVGSQTSGLECYILRSAGKRGLKNGGTRCPS